jgi:predicted amidohydrolase YtcJ
MLIANVQVIGRSGLVDVRCAQGVIAQVGSSLARVTGEQVIDGAGAALLPGLHDHHIHLFALAALHNSVQCGPPAVSSRAQLAAALREDRGSGWLRGVGYHESVAGSLGRRELDELVAHRPLKIQHRSGKLWMVNSLAAQLLALDGHAQQTGVELDEAGKPNGRLYRLDGWMRAQLAQSAPASMPSLARLSRLLASYGVTGLTDTTPDNDAVTLREFERAASSGELLQRLRVMGGDALPASAGEQVQSAERKVMLDDNRLPGWDELCTVIRGAHGKGRAVAVHCVTPAELVLTLSALRDVGVHPGDRIEHASLVPQELLPLLRETGVRVVTQPGFIHERGDQYLDAIAPPEHDDLYRGRTFLTQRIPLAGSTDAPYGNPDPWAAMRAAVHRRSRAAQTIGAQEVLTPEEALALFTSAGDDPGGASRAIAVGQPADLCLLSYRWEQARLRLCAEDVSATLRQGEFIYRKQQPVLSGEQHAAPP